MRAKTFVFWVNGAQIRKSEDQTDPVPGISGRDKPGVLLRPVRDFLDDELQKCSAQWDPQAQSPALRALRPSQAWGTRGLDKSEPPIWVTFRCFETPAAVFLVCTLTLEPAEFIQNKDERRTGRPRALRGINANKYHKHYMPSE